MEFDIYYTKDKLHDHIIGSEAHLKWYVDMEKPQLLAHYYGEIINPVLSELDEEQAEYYCDEINTLMDLASIEDAETITLQVGDFTHTFQITKVPTLDQIRTFMHGLVPSEKYNRATVKDVPYLYTILCDWQANNYPVPQKYIDYLKELTE